MNNFVLDILLEKIFILIRKDVLTEYHIKQQEKGSLLPLRLPRHDTTAGCRIWTKNKRKLKQRSAAELPAVLLMQISTGKNVLYYQLYQSKNENGKVDFY